MRDFCILKLEAIDLVHAFNGSLFFKHISKYQQKHVNLSCGCPMSELDISGGVYMANHVQAIAVVVVELSTFRGLLFSYYFRESIWI